MIEASEREALLGAIWVLAGPWCDDEAAAARMASDLDIDDDVIDHHHTAAASLPRAPPSRYQLSPTLTHPQRYSPSQLSHISESPCPLLLNSQSIGF